MEKRQSLPQAVLGKLDCDTLNNEVRTFPHIIYKKTLKTGLKGDSAWTVILNQAPPGLENRS